MAAPPNLFEIAGRHADVFESLYQMADPGGSGSVSAQTAAGVLQRSKLPNPILAKVWELSDEAKKGSLDKRGFFVALKLIALAQAGQELSPLNLRLDTAPPHLEGGAPPPRPPSIPASPARGADEWAIGGQDRAKYEAIFDSLGPTDGKLLGEQVRPVLLNSGLPQITLGRIWTLSDIDEDGKLDKEEMCVALHLVYRALENTPVPSALPPQLVPPGKRSITQRRASLEAETRSRSGSEAGPGFQAGGPQYMQRGYGTTGPTRSLTTTPVPVQLGGLDSVEGSPAHQPPSQPPPPAAWPIDINKHAALFVQLDTDR